MERGVTSRARKRFEGRETTPDPRYGGRPGQRSSKWQPPRAPRTTAQRSPTPSATHRVRLTLPEHLHEKLMDIVAAERSLGHDPRSSPSDTIARLIRDYEVPADVMGVIASRHR